MSLASPPLTLAPSYRSTVVAWLLRLGPLLGLAAVFVLFSILRPRTFLRVDNLETIVRQSAVVLTVALGMTLIIISGGIDLSVGSNVAVCAVTTALLLNAGFGDIPSMLGGVAIGAASGLLTGLLVTQLRLRPFIATLGLWGGLRGLAILMADRSSVYTSDCWLKDLMAPLQGDRKWMILPPGVWMTILLGLLVAGILRYTRFGRHVFAVGSNEQTARLCGVNVTRTKLAVYMLAAALTGFAGVLQYSYENGSGDPTTARGLELDVIAAVVIGGASLSGGAGSVLGTFSGALLMAVVANGCNKLDLDPSVQQMVTGGIIIIAAALDRLRHRGRQE